MPPGAGAGADLGAAAPVRADEPPLGSRLGFRAPELLEDASPADPDDDPDDDELPDEALPELVVPLDVEPDEPEDELPAVVPGRATAWAQARAGHESPIATASTVALRMDEVMTPSPESA